MGMLELAQIKVNVLDWSQAGFPLTALQDIPRFNIWHLNIHSKGKYIQQYLMQNYY
jgi:hypothetical protein